MLESTLDYLVIQGSHSNDSNMDPHQYIRHKNHVSLANSLKVKIPSLLMRFWELGYMSGAPLVGL